MMEYKSLATTVLAVAYHPHGNASWVARIAAVPGKYHNAEAADVVAFGTKLDEPIARALFPDWVNVDYDAR